MTLRTIDFHLKTSKYENQLVKLISSFVIASEVISLPAFIKYLSIFIIISFCKYSQIIYFHYKIEIYNNVFL